MSDSLPPLPDGDEVFTLKHDPAISNLAEVAFDLVVVDGPDRGLQLTVDVASPARVLIGQSPACDLKLSDRSASRRHASVELTERGLRLTDLASTNGTFVGALSVMQLRLRGGETVRIGKSLIEVRSRRVAAPPAEPSPPDRFGRLVGSSIEMRQLYPLCERLAQTRVPLIIEGETGTGKEVLAESLHERGTRATGPFVVFDCTAVSPDAVESELFGHEVGAFSGAVAARRGLFEQAQGGTLLIDEIGDLDLTIQPKLLRAIERSQIRRAGGDQPIQVDVRIICTTRRDLDREVLVGRFRDDLFHRLAVARIELPPLRRRRSDVRVLVDHFCAELGADEETKEKRIVRQLRKWEDDPWPGNVRELRNAVARQLALGDLDLESDESDESDEVASATEEPATASSMDTVERIIGQRLPFGRARTRLLAAFRERYVEQALADHGGNIARAAAASGIGRRYFQRMKSKKSSA